ncbi:ENHANCER OF AG-4 protein 2-like [Phalaenopsis equestris]|uniref:ENHANCER OF AG-4 protein 2-like n=1 Tax=Phalaenopsis equestris TaxID=78828 RepID=UPI0009E2798B|nr:ENHANCER OF AG-4 protein 2-like [Phalaenopsis equestris]
MEGNTSNGGKPGVSGGNKKKSTKKCIPREELVVGKLATSEGNPVLKPAADRKGDCFQSGAIKRKMSGNVVLPSAKRSLFKNERVNLSKSSGENESSHLTGGQKNNKNLNFVRPESVRADNCIPSTTPACDNMNQSGVIKLFNGSGDFSKSSSTGTEDSTKNRIVTNEMNFKHNNTSLIPFPPKRRALRLLEDVDGDKRRNPVHRVTTVTLRECSGYGRKSDMRPETCWNFPQNGDKNFAGNVSSRVNKSPNNVTGSMGSMEGSYSASRPRNDDVNVLKRSADLLASSNSVRRKKCKSASPNGRAANNELKNLVSSGYTDNLGSLKALKQHGRKKSSALPKSNISVLVHKNRSHLNFTAEKDVLAGQSSDITKEATADSADGKLTDTTLSMKHLIAAAKAKKRLAHSHQRKGNLLRTDSSNGSSEVEIARETFERMIETLSRSRDSIRRATRQAIDCAKYGIANEVVELLIHKLEDEPSLSHRIDLFFLVDSITQCSQKLKEASYAPVVQAALPRILGAAAPSGSSAQENRRQCLKVLTLWRERRILPEYILRHYMDEIEFRNDGLNSEFSSRIPSCAEQCVDDPIREVESLHVDQYGSNAAFLFPGILSTHVLEDDEDFPSSPCNDTAGFCPHKLGVSEAVPGSEGRPMEAHHHTLEHVENEIEMEDELTLSFEERSIGEVSTYNYTLHKEHCSALESIFGNNNGLLLLPAESPPLLPLDPPPSPPPLPSSPPPPTPPPPSSPPPMSPPTVSSLHQVSYSSSSFQQCGETIQQMPPHSSLPALKILNHSLPSSQIPSGHLSHGNSMFHHASTFLLGQGTFGAKELHYHNHL